MGTFLPALILLPLACGAPAQVPPTAPVAPAEPSLPEAAVRTSRPRTWDRLLVGLTRLPSRPLLTAKPAGPGRLIEIPSRRLLARVPAGAPLMLSVAGNDRVRFETRGAAGSASAIRLESGTGSCRLEGRRLDGALICWPAGSQVVCALDAPLEAYLYGVLPGEVPASWPLEAQKALAVAARTYAQASRGKHAEEGFDLCDGTHCQMYLGRVPGAARSELAVRATRGLVALSGNDLIRAFYSADCGGRTANNEDVPFADNPLEPQPYLRSVVDAPRVGAPHYCARSSHHRWTRLLTADRIEAAVNVEPTTAVGVLRELRVSAVDVSGRAKTIRLDGLIGEILGAAGARERQEGVAVAQRGGSTPAPPSPRDLLFPDPRTQPAGPQLVTRELPGYAFRRSVGPRLLKSTRFTVQRVASTQYRFSGAGYGHGVGLCQIGARGMAAAPYRRTFRQILAHYYRGVRIVAFKPSGEPP